MVHIGKKTDYLFYTAVIQAHYQMKHGVTNTVNNSTHLRHASSLDYFNRTKDK